MGVSLAIHAGLAISVLAASNQIAVGDAEGQPPTVTYFEVESLEGADAELATLVDEPEAPPPEPEPPTPELEPEPLPEFEPDPSLLAGFQELRVPLDMPTILEALPDGPSVSEEDFRGRGLAGGFARGLRTVPPPSGPAEGSGESAVRPDEVPYYLPDVLSQVPALKNGPEVAQYMSLFYPPALLRQGEGGRVLARFVITDSGSVDEATVTILESAHPGLADATLRLLRELRFEPGIRNGLAVPVLVQFPVTWSASG